MASTPPDRHDPPADPSFREAYAAARAELADVRAERTELAFRCERLEAAFAASSDGVWDVDLQSGRVHVSDCFARMLGRDLADMGDNVPWVLDLVHPEDRAGVESLFERHIAGARDRPYRVQIRLRHRDGHWVTVLSRGEVVRDHEGRPVRFIGTHVDLATQEQAEKTTRPPGAVWHAAA